MLAKGAAVFAVADSRFCDRHPFSCSNRLVGGKGDGKTIEQMVCHGAFLWIEGGNQQRLAGVANT